MANTKEHDVYFYQRPQDMLGGAVNPPHIFLKATAVLERQLTAYALDRWVHGMLESGVSAQNIIPNKLGMCLNNVEEHEINGFPSNFLAYAGGNAGRLLDGFTRLFDFPKDVRDQLDEFLRGKDGSGTMAYRIHQVFERTIDTVCALKEQRDTAEQLLDDLNGKPDDPSYEEQKRECKDEIRGLNRILTALEKQTNTFNYLSDEGVLPNYAFPETGVTLHTILKADPSETVGGTESGTKPAHRQVTTRDFVRPAASAITELAPGNTFFAGGRKYTINRVLCSRNGLSQDAVMWRICPNCSHAEPVSASENLACCPSCGSMQWADSGQKRPMIRINTVISEETYKNSLVDDSSDSRPHARFVKNTLVDITGADVASAYRITGATDFGFEYIPQGTIREINFGETSASGIQIEVAGGKESCRGFTVCVKCGALAGDHGVIKHSYSCPERNGAMHDARSSTCLFLYREVQ